MKSIHPALSDLEYVHVVGSSIDAAHKNPSRLQVDFALPGSTELQMWKRPEQRFEHRWHYQCAGYIDQRDMGAVREYLNIYQRLLIELGEWPSLLFLGQWWCWLPSTREKLTSVDITELAAHLAGHREYLRELGEWHAFGRKNFLVALSVVWERSRESDSDVSAGE